MWTKNGAETLPSVLRRISEVIPKDAVNMKLIVDDRSSDNTREIAKACGWTVTLKRGKRHKRRRQHCAPPRGVRFVCKFRAGPSVGARLVDKIPAYLLDSNVRWLQACGSPVSLWVCRGCSSTWRRSTGEGIAGFVAQGQGDGRFYAGENSGQHHL